MATQTGRAMSFTSPLGVDLLLAQALRGEEAVSALFNFTVDVMGASNKVVDFSKLLGEGVGVKLFADDGATVVRNIHGHVRCITQGESDKNNTRYSLEIVPRVWMLTKRAQSRIFQQIKVTDILKEVLKGFDFRIDADDSKLKPRDYCVQYRETDWNFASRLMEEEGIFYFFEFGDMSHKLVITSAGKAPAVKHNANITYKNVQHGAADKEEFIYSFTKSQEMVAGKVLLWDHCFEDPPKHFESPENIPASVTQGGVTHKLNVANDKLELYDFPGEFAQRFDGVDPGGADRAADVANIPPDGARTAKIRAEAEACTAVWGTGQSTCGHLTPGHKFTMKTQAGDVLTVPIKADGEYMILSVTHTARMQDAFKSGGSRPFIYQNSFEVIANSVSYRPPRYTYKPVVPGSQTATVVGPKDQEIFTDKYGRVKVQFHWDREGKKDAGSSCWIRVGTPWAGRNWGIFGLPRIGQEVIVDFIEGDPDQPIIVGSVYNAHQMPAYKQPDHKTKSWIKSNSTTGGEGYNEIRFEDKKGEEQIYVHGERNYDKRIRNESMVIINNHSHMIVGGEDVTANKKDLKADYREKIYQDKHLKVMRHQEEHIEGSYKLLVGHATAKEKPPDPGNLLIVLEANRMEIVGGESHLHVAKSKYELIDTDDHLHVKGNSLTTIDGDANIHIKGAQKILVDGNSHIKVGDHIQESLNGFGLKTANVIQMKSGSDFGIDAGGLFSVKAASNVLIQAGTKISLKVGGNCVVIDSSGVSIVGSVVKINSGGSGDDAKSLSPPAPAAPTDATDAKDAAQAKPTEPTVADKSVTGKKSSD